MSNTIDQKIIDYKVLDTSKAVPVQALHERDEALTGSTYKIKTEDFAYYVTINNHVVNGVTHPFEIFINTKNAERYPSLLVLTRLVSAYFRTGHEYSFIAEELKQIVDPKGGYWKQGTYYASFEAELGNLLEKHFENLRN